jgi:uncharacterized protein
MKIGCISDTHIPTRMNKLPDEVAEAFKGVNLILCAGDLEVESVLDDLEAIAPVKAVAGNMDRHLDSIRCPNRRVVEAEGHRIGLIHGWGGPDDIAVRLADEFAQSRVGAVVFGHSHRPTVETREGILMVNPGSPTDRMFAPYRSVAIMHVEKDAPLRAEIILLKD